MTSVVHFEGIVLSLLVGQPFRLSLGSALSVLRDPALLATAMKTLEKHHGKRHPLLSRVWH